ncbi:hypothetical protein HYH03_002116 [Edaphochlamys debaryana]|uniref:Transcription initiation factor IIE subunit alpha N-terminal domain-containing protein n=1 Tax=Edaphochlamys debaryana TaxID=47281 RepID=A0A836C5H0_9CHLO|nr:hypothetical protein HYH03_002116 [Edaphochlamys debaryana]|eukprot:KAG2499824.1 hypothetical protein HYH03_002116 [Edaphochlamys debaryana]
MNTGGAGYAPVTYQRLMRLAARAFYGGPCPPPGRDPDFANSRSKIAKMDTRGLGVVIVDYLTTVEWTSSELLSEALKLHPVILSRALRFLEAGHMLRRYERRESRRKKRTIVGDALEAEVAQPDSDDDDEDEAKKKGLLTEYFTIDYARAFDAIQVRINTMRKALKDQLESTNAVQGYYCPGSHCGKTYTSLDAANLVDPDTLEFKCEICGSKLMEKTATDGAAAAGGEAQHATAKERKESDKALLKAIESELAPITRLMAELQHRSVPLPDPGELFEWAQRVRQRDAEAAAAAAKSGGSGAGGGGGGSKLGGGAGGSSNPAAMLAGTGVTVLSAADNTNTWEAQDFKINLDGGGGLLLGGGGASGSLAGVLGAAGGPGGGAGGGAGAAASKKPNALPWFMKPADAQAGDAVASPSAAGPSGAAASAPADSGKHAAFFQDFMASMAKLQEEKKTVLGPGGPLSPLVKTEPFAHAVKREPGAATPLAAAAAAPHPAVKPEPGLAAPPLGPAAPAVKPPAVAEEDLEWEEVAAPPLAGVKVEAGVKPEPHAHAHHAAGAPGGVVEVDEEDWEDV